MQMKYLKLLWKLYRLKKNIRKTPARIRKLQEKKLRKMLAYAYEHSDYYRKSFEQAGIGRENIADTPLSAFPVIDKKLLLQNFDELVTVSELKQEKLRRFDAEETGNRKLFHPAACNVRWSESW